MKKLFTLFVFLALALPGWSQAFRRSNTNLPFITAASSNHVVLIERGGSVAPANLPFGSMAAQLMASNSATATTASNLWWQPYIFSPMQYGGVGDGVANDTVAVSNCLAAANMFARPTMDLSGKIWDVNMSLVVTQRNFTLVNGKLTTTNSAVTLVDVRNDGFRAENVFLGGPGTNWTANSIGFSFERTGTYIQRPILSYCKLTNFWFGVKAISAVEMKIENSQITACGSNGVWGITCDGLDITQTVLGNSTDEGGNLADPGVGTKTSKTNAFCFIFEGGQRQLIENCDMNASGSVGMVLNNTAGSPHFTMWHNNFEEFWHPTRPYLLLSNISFTFEYNKFSPKTGPSAIGLQLKSIIGSKSRIGPNLDVGIDPPVELVSGQMPTIAGFWDNELNNNIVSNSGTGTWRGQTQVDPNGIPIQQRIVQQNGDSAYSMIMGGNSGSYGVTDSNAKDFRIGMPSYGTSSTIIGAIMGNTGSSASDSRLWLGYAGGNAFRYLSFATSTDGGIGGAQHQWQMSSSGFQAVAANLAFTATGTITGRDYVHTVATVSLTADNQAVGATTNSFLSISSDNATAANRTFSLTTGIPGKIIILTWTGTNAGELTDDGSLWGSGNLRLASTWTPTQYDSITLIGVGVDWHELSRSAN